MKLARMRTCGGGGTSETAVVGSLLLCCTCARGLRMPPCLSCSWKFPLSAEIAPCVAGVEIRGRARRPALSRCHAHAFVKTCIERERRERERTPPSVLCSSFRPLAWRRPWRGRGRQGKERAGGRGRKELEGVSKSERVSSKNVGKIKARFGKINAPHHGMYHLG